MLRTRHATQFRCRVRKSSHQVRYLKLSAFAGPDFVKVRILILSEGG
jgi:hypothetical protein